MRKTTPLMKSIAVLTLLGLAGCARVAMSGDEMVAQCKAEVAPGGTYEYDEGMTIPVMRAVDNGTKRGERAFNACIRGKAVKAGMIPVTSSTGHTGGICPNGAPFIYGGSTYCIKDY